MASIADLISNLKKKLTGGYNTVADALPIVPNTSQIKSFTANPVQFMSNPSYNGGNNLFKTTPFKLGAQVQTNIYKNAQSPDPMKNNFAKMYVNAGEAVRDYFDPRKTPTLLSKQGAENYGKAVGLTALPVLNMAMAPKVTPQTFLGSAGIGAGFNAVLGNKDDHIAKRLRYGAISGIQSAPLTRLVTGFSNPVTDKLVSKIPLKNLAPKAKAIVEGVARGAAAIPEGMAINAAQRQPYTPLDLALDVATGSGLSSYAGGKMGKAGDSALGSFLDWYKKNSMTSSQKAFARQAMIGNVRAMHPEDLVIFDQANTILKNKRKFTPDRVKEASDYMYDFAEKYLPRRLQPDGADANLIANRLQKRMAQGDLQTFEGGFAKLDEPIVGTSTKYSPTQMTREEMIARDMLKKKTITPQQYNEIAVKNEGKIKPIQGIPTDRTLDHTLQTETSSILNSAPSQERVATPVLPPQQPKSGVSKIGEPPIQSPSEGIISNVKNYVDQLYTQAVDRFHPLSKIAKQAGQDQAMRNAITQHYGAGSTATFHVDFELSPILKEVDANDLRSYTIAKRDIELSGRGMKGSDKEAAQKVINELKMKHGADFGKIESTANRLYSYQDSLVKKYLVDTGIISRKSYEAMRKNNKAYIPFKRVMDQVDGFLGATPQTKSMGSVSSQSVIKKIKGSDRDIIDPLQSIVENTYKIVTVGQRNKVAKAIISLRKQLPELIRPFSGEVGNRQDILSIFENGEVLKYQVPRDVAEAAKGLNEESLNALIKILAVPSKLVRATATGINPEFMIPNVTRDMQSAFVNVGLNPMTFVSGLSHLLKKDDVYQDFLRSGGKTSSIMIDRPYLKKTVGDITGKPGLEVLNPLRLLQTLGEYSEQPTRIAIFEKTKNKLIKQGLSIAEAEVQAANKAQEGTVNFARMGSKMKAANSLVTFLNARLQGADLLFRNVKSNPSGTLFRLGLVSQVPAVLSYLYNRQFESYNDERVVSKYDKEGNFVIMLSDSPIESLGGAQFIKIPKGDVGRFANPTESFLSYLDGKGDDNTVNEIAKAFLGLLPFQNIGDAIPAAIKPPIEWAANRSFFTKQPLVPEYKEALPAKYQYTSKTAPLYKIVGDKLNLSPAKLENTTAGYLTGFEKMGNTAFNALTGQKPDSQQGSGINRVPVARRFLGGEKRTSDEQSIIDDKRANSIDFQINDVKGAVNRGDVPMNEGVKQIELLRQKQQEIRNKQTTTAQMGNGSIKTEVQGQAGKTYYFKDTEGKLREINISTPIQAPTMTGNAELDKKLVSKYNSKLSSRAGNIADLYQAGQISADEAEKLLSEIVNMKVSTAKGKTIKIGKVAKIKTPKIKLAKVKNVKFKIPKLKLARAKTIKFKSLKSKSLVKLKA